MDNFDPSNPFKVLNYPEVVARVLSLLRYPLAYYMETIVGGDLSKIPTESMEANSDIPNLGILSLDVPQLIDAFYRYRSSLPDIENLKTQLNMLRVMRNQWAHQEQLTETAMSSFLASAEDVLSVVVEARTQECYRQVRYLRQYHDIYLAEKAMEEWTIHDGFGNSMIQPPTLISPETIYSSLGIESNPRSSNGKSYHKTRK